MKPPKRLQLQLHLRNQKSLHFETVEDEVAAAEKTCSSGLKWHCSDVSSHEEFKQSLLKMNTLFLMHHWTVVEGFHLNLVVWGILAFVGSPQGFWFWMRSQSAEGNRASEQAHRIHLV